MRRKTLARAFEVSGVGLHSGDPVRVEVRPGGWGNGWTLGSGGQRVTVGPHTGSAVPGASRVHFPGSTVSTPEHLFAAAYAQGLTDLHIEVVHGSEFPALDGSAEGWREHLDQAGSVEHGTADVVRLTAPVRVEMKGGVACAWPSDALHVGVEVDFGPEGPQGALSIKLTQSTFEAEVSWARTFVLARDVQALRAAGRGKGATEQNTVIWGSEQALRAPDEPVRHKMLDLIGDLAWLGRPLVARVEVVRGHHALHHALVRAISEA